MDVCVSGCDDAVVTAVGVLGPLMLRGPGGPVVLRSLRQRRVLTALVAHLGAAVSTDVLVDMVWDREPLPVDPGAALQTNVARLRRMLPATVELVTAASGYLVVADRTEVDAMAFVDHVTAAMRTQDPHVQVRELEAGMALWRGVPYVDLDHPDVQPERVRLSALRVSAIEQHAAALLAIGRTAESVSALEGLLVEDPLRESAVELLVRALVAAGRQSDALTSYTRLRTRLADELGLDPSPALRALEQQVLRQEVVLLPAPEPSTAPAPTLPVPVSSFVGRDDDVSSAGRMLKSCRVLTLAGPGGVGKTRLAVHVAAAVAARYDAGVLLVELGDGGPGDVLATVAGVVRLADGAGDALLDRLVEALAGRRLLLVLDNCEHVASEVATLAEALTVRTEGVDLLLTSREPLRVDGEQVFAVRPLTAPAAEALLDARLRAADRDSDLEPDRERLISELCRRLDGLPLALELAAARAPSLGLRGLLTAIDRPLDVLRTGRRTTSVRHRSLRDVVEWSYKLLDEPQRRLFDQLSVFAGSVEAAAVTAVCDDADPLPDLIDRSLVVRHLGDPTRFGLLETLRAFGRSRLVLDPTAAHLRARHADWAVGLAEAIGRQRRGPGEAAAVRRFDAHLPDLRRAHAWLRDHGPLENLLCLNILFGELAYLRGRGDLVLLVEEALAVADEQLGSSAAPADRGLQARLLALLAATSWQRGNLERAQELAQRCVSVPDLPPQPAAMGHEALANVHLFGGRLELARDHAEQACVLALQADDVDVQVVALVDLVLIATYLGDDLTAAQHEIELLSMGNVVTSETNRAFVDYACGERRAGHGDPDAAQHLEAAITAAESVDSAFVAGVARHTLLTSSARDGLDQRVMPADFGPLLDFWQGFGAWTQWWIAARALSEILSRLDRHADAAVLLGALAAASAAPPPFGPDLARARAVEAAARTALGEQFAVQEALGAGLDQAQAVAFAHRLTRPGSADNDETATPSHVAGSGEHGRSGETSSAV
jgi:predicted ATPase/DNA-binding SARP family transcriptional activator